MSFMQSLPIELVQKIFEPVCSPPGPLLDELPDEIAARLLASPYRLAAVCRDWRDICMRTPQIWSFIYLDLHSPPTDILYIQRQLERSAGVSIDLVLATVNVIVLRDQLRLLGEHARWWRRVTIKFTSEIPQDLYAILKQPMPRLEQLRLLSRDGIQNHLLDNSWDPESRSQYFEISSRLSHLESQVMVIVPSIQWHSLRFLNYNVRYVTKDPLWLTLAQTPALEELNIFLPQWMLQRRDSQPLAAPIDLPMLQRLGVYGFLGCSSWPEFLRAPRLETLTVSLETCNRLGTLLRAPAVRQQIRHLTITTIEVHDGGFLNRPDAEAMGELQRLETLELRNLGTQVLKEYDVTFFAYLAGQDGAPAPAWARRLRRLVLRKCQFFLSPCRSLGQYLRLRVESANGPDGLSFDFDFVDTKFMVVSERDFETGNSLIGSFFAGYTITPLEVNDTTPVNSS